MEYLIIAARIVTIMGLLLVLTLLTGRRKIGELPVFDFLVVITIGAVVGADIADPKIEHLPTAFAVALILLIHYMYSIAILKSRKIGKLITFEPVVVIENGQFVKKNMMKLKYSIDNVLMMLREKDIFDLQEVEFAVIESSGKLSVLKKAQNQPVTPKDLKIGTEYRGLSIPLIVEGKIYEDNLGKLNLDRKWLESQLEKHNINSVKSVFYAAINTDGSIYISRGHEYSKDIHDVRH